MLLTKSPSFSILKKRTKDFLRSYGFKRCHFLREAIDDEMKSILSKQYLGSKKFGSNSRCKSIKCKLVFIRKRNTDRIVHTFKVRRVAKGFNQKKEQITFTTMLWWQQSPLLRLWLLWHQYMSYTFIKWMLKQPF